MLSDSIPRQPLCPAACCRALNENCGFNHLQSSPAIDNPPLCLCFCVRISFVFSKSPGNLSENGGCTLRVNCQTTCPIRVNTAYQSHLVFSCSHQSVNFFFYNITYKQCYMIRTTFWFNMFCINPNEQERFLSGSVGWISFFLN